MSNNYFGLTEIEFLQAMKEYEEWAASLEAKLDEEADPREAYFNLLHEEL